jgi:zinc transport system ATP-binding protein
MDMVQLICQNVSLGYDGKTVVKNLNFTVNRGDYLCIIGENGSGKSTLMKAILKLKKPLGGTFRMGEGVKACEIGYLPQQTNLQKDFPASVREVVLSGCLGRCGIRPFYTKAERKTAEANMLKMGIHHLENQCYRELSGGQQQRVLLARALCAARSILLLDEPVAGLDPHATQEMYDLVKKQNREEGLTILMVSHDVETAIKYASHILHVSSTPLFFGTKEDYLQSEVGRRFTEGMGGGQND